MIVLCFLNPYTQYLMKFASFAGLGSDIHVHVTTETAYSHKGSLKMETARLPNKSNGESGIPAQERQNRVDENKIMKTNGVQKHIFLCNNPSGRLGNQLFDFASSMGIANTLNYTFAMPSTHPLLGLFEINQPVLAKKPKNLRTVTLHQWRNKWWGSNGTYLAFNLTLSGYYRVWRYFKDVTDAVRKSLTIKGRFIDKAETFLKFKTPSNRTLVGIHVRRGDFLTEEQQAYGKAVASKKYISTAMTYFQERYSNSFFVVVSNDKRWCKDNLAGKDVVVSEYNEAIIDLAIMTLCNHAIMTSGTFGWWGAWLSGGEVVYWKGFPKPGSKNERDILFRGEFYPPHWSGIDSD